MKQTLIRNALIYNTWLRRFLPGWVLIEDERIRYAFCEGSGPDTADEIIDAKGCLCIPSLIDIHLHVESSMVTPAPFSHELLRRGVTTCIAEPHEIANVFGMEGIKAFIRAGKDAEMDILWAIPSSVPCTPYETTGGRIELDDALELLTDPAVHCLGEVMNGYSLLHEPEGKTRTWLDVLRHDYPNVVREGHIAYYRDRELCDIAYYGVDSDHTMVGRSWAEERLKMGVFGELQDKSLIPETVEWIEQEDIWDHFCLVTDDTMPDRLISRGHLDYLVRKAVALGMKPERVIRAVTWNPAQRMRLHDRGMIAPGMLADIMLVDSMKEFNILRVFKNGRTVYRADDQRTAGACTRQFPEHFYSSVRLAPLSENDFIISAKLPDGMHRARIMAPDAASGRILEAFRDIAVKQNRVVTEGSGCCIIAVFDRYTGSGRRMVGLADQKDFLKKGAVACTYAHDHHNLLVAGCSISDCVMAANWVISRQGGYCAVLDGQVMASMELEVGGIVSERPVPEIAREAERISKALTDFGYRFPNPIMSFSVLGLTVSPALRITDKGYVDVRNGTLLGVFDD